jgi:hypothetical protein
MNRRAFVRIWVIVAQRGVAQCTLLAIVAVRVFLMWRKVLVVGSAHSFRRGDFPAADFFSDFPIGRSFFCRADFPGPDGWSDFMGRSAARNGLLTGRQG